MLRLMHVEDDEDIREVAKMALELSGKFELLQCESGEEALKKAPEFMPAIFMTARAQPAEIEELKAISAIAVVVKPFDPITLGDQIMDALNA